MSILETFYILFKADTTGVKKGTEEAKKTTDDLNETLHGTANAGERVGEVFFSIAEQFSKVAASALSIYAVIDGLKAAADYTGNLDLASRTLGVNIEQLDAWGNALRITGGDAKSFQAALASFSQHTGAAPAVAEKFLPQFLASLQKLNQVQAFQYGHAFGLDDSLILLGRQYGTTVAQLIQRQKELGVVTEKDRLIQNQFNQSWINTQHVFRNLFVNMDSELLPVLTRFFNILQPGIIFLQQHVGIVLGGLAGLLTGVTYALWGLIAAAAELLAIPALFVAAGVAIGALISWLSSLDITQEKIVNGFREIGRWGTEAFDKIRDAVRWVEEEVMILIGYFKELYEFFKKPFGEANGRSFLVPKAQQALTLAQGFPLAAQTFGSIFNSAQTSSPQTVTTGDITINTLASDAQGVYIAVRDLFTKLMHGATNLVDNGVAK